MEKKKNHIPGPCENFYKLICTIHTQEPNASYNALTLEIGKIFKQKEKLVVGIKFYVPEVVSISSSSSSWES